MHARLEPALTTSARLPLHGHPLRLREVLVAAALSALYLLICS